MTTTAPKMKIPEFKEKRVLAVLLWQRDSENLWLLHEHDKQGKSKPRSQALILSDLMEDKVKELELR